MNQEELNKILEEHEKWLINSEEGKRADLRNADLRNADLRNADLRYADLSYADLSYADLREADLKKADLRNADFRFANLKKADLRNADLRFANLRFADLVNADFRKADLRYADFRDANFDYSIFPLWCGSFNMIVDGKFISQLIYHIFRLQGEDENLEKIKKTEWLKNIANQFHRADECGKIK